MTPEEKTALHAQAAIQFAIVQRNSHAQDSIQLSADNAVLRKENEELAARVAEFEAEAKKKAPIAKK